jgi:MoxR-like ATPase
MATLNFDNAPFSPPAQPPPGSQGYVYHDPRIVLAVNVALASGRPLFVTGSPGTGKSTLSRAVAHELSWAHAGITITSRTRMEDLVYRFDTVQRLSDAQEHKALPAHDYLIPGILWWAFAPASAAEQRLARDCRDDVHLAGNGIVVLLDEIDKAEPDLPNDLLAPLDSYVVDVPGGVEGEAERRDRKGRTLIVITSNGERSMPPAFLRRCIVLELDDEDPSFFEGVATSHFGERDDTLYADLASHTRMLSQAASATRRRKPSMAEYLDTLQACIAYGQRPATGDLPATDLWAAIEEAALRKTRMDHDGAGGA